MDELIIPNDHSVETFFVCMTVLALYTLCKVEDEYNKNG